LAFSQTDLCPFDSPGFSKSDVTWAVPYEYSFTIADGEVDSLVKVGVSENPELPDQMVKSRPQVVTNISDYKRNINRNGFKLLKPEYVLSLITINFNSIDHIVWITFKKPLNQVIQDLEMISCSAEFEKRSIERMHTLCYNDGDKNEREQTKNSEGTRDTHITITAIAESGIIHFAHYNQRHLNGRPDTGQWCSCL